MPPAISPQLTRRTLFQSVCLAGSLAATEANSEDRIEPIQARRTRDFTNFLGVNTHFSQRTPRYRDWQRAANDLDYLGVRIIRDGCSDSPATLAAYRGLLSRGIGLCAVYNWGTLPQMLAAARALTQLGSPGLVAIEGPNEPNNFPISFQGRTTKFAPVDKGGTFLPVAKLQAALYREVKQDPALRHVPVWQVSMAGAEPDNCGLQFLKIPPGAGTLMPDGTTFADMANLHIYTSNGKQAWAPDDDRFHHEMERQHHRTWGYQVLGGTAYEGYSANQLALPAVISEIGYHTNAPASPDAVDAQTQAKNLLDAAFDAWTAGFKRFVMYELYDSGGNPADDESHYGLFDADLRPKPVARALHELANLLGQGREKAFTPGRVGLRLSGLPRTADSTLLQGSDGAFRLVVWNTVPTWDGEKRQSVQNAPVQVAIQFDKTWPRIASFDPLVGAEPVSHADGKREIMLSLTDHPLVVVFSDQAGR